MLVAVYNVRTIFRAVHVLHYRRTIKGRRPCKNVACHDNPKTRRDNNKCKWILLKRRVSLCLGDWLASSPWRALWLQAKPILAHALQCNLYDDHNQTNEFVHSATNSNIITNRTYQTLYLWEQVPWKRYVYKGVVAQSGLSRAATSSWHSWETYVKRSHYAPTFSRSLFSGLKQERNWRWTQHVPLKLWYPFTVQQCSNNLYHFQPQPLRRKDRAI